MDELKSGIISPTLVFDDNTGKPVDFHCLKLLQYSSFKGFDTISGVVEEYYALKYSREFNSQKVKNLHDTVSRLLEKRKAADNKFTNL